MTDNSAPKPRKSLFRAIALQRYRGPIELDTPHTLVPPRYGLIVAAVLIALAVSALWVF